MSIRRSIEWLKLMMRSEGDSATEYDLRGDAHYLRSDEGFPMMNMGFWRGVDVHEKDAMWRATTALFDLVSTSAELTGRDERVLDAGCGFGTNAIRCVEKFGVGSVIGLNVSSVQLEIGRRLVASRGLEERISLLPRSVTDMPFPDNFIDKVVSVEAAFHFATRRDFFREAFRVLKPGGLIALADFVAPPPRSLWERGVLFSVRRALQIPSANVYDMDPYRRTIESAGFEVIDFHSIRDEVLPPCRRWVTSRAAQILSHDPVFALSSSGFLAYPWEYVLIKARRRG